MKDDAIREMTSRGIPAEKAEKHWQTICEKLNDGDPLTTAGLADLDDGTIKGALPPVAAAAIIALRDAAKGGTKGPKGRKFKPGRAYTATEYAEHYERDPENADIVADIARATDGKPWVVFKDRFRAAESARYIQWHMDEEFAPATVDVDGVPVAPVMPGEERRKEAKEYPVDPHTPGGFLTVEGKSPRTGADFTGYTDEEIQATIVAYSKLQRMDDISVQRFTVENKGRGAAAILKPFPEIAAVWARMKPGDRPKVRAPKRPFVDPTADSTAPRGGDGAPIQPSTEPNEIHRAIVSSGLAANRRSLFAGIDPQFVASLPRTGDDASQALSDISQLCAVSKAGGLDDGSDPWTTYLQNAIVLSGPRREASVFKAALARIRT